LLVVRDGHLHDRLGSVQLPRDGDLLHDVARGRIGGLRGRNGQRERGEGHRTGECLSCGALHASNLAPASKDRQATRRRTARTPPSKSAQISTASLWRGATRTHLKTPSGSFEMSVLPEKTVEHSSQKALRGFLRC